MISDQLFNIHSKRLNFNSYDEVCDYVSTSHKIVLSLDHFKKMMEDLNNPQNLLKVIHVAGTNGKGSTTAYLRSVLNESGYKVATFTSPALVNRLDVIRINNINIEENRMINYANKYLELCMQYHLSQFEIEVFFSILYFIDEQVDFCIYEVGLGGRLDATNIVSPIICAITNIGLDHVDFLGHSYQEIAREKAGIIKEEIPLITTEKREEVLREFKEECIKHHTKVYLTLNPTNVKNDPFVSFDYNHLHIKLNTLAKYQISNCILAIEMLQKLEQLGYIQLNETNLLNGLYKMSWPGRFEIIRENPLIILDGAHNKEGMEAFIESAKQLDNVKIIFSALKDKDTHHMIESLLSITSDVTITCFNHHRAAAVDDLKENFNVKTCENWYQLIDENLDYKGTLIITGSLYFISQVRAYLLTQL